MSDENFLETFYDIAVSNLFIKKSGFYFDKNYTKISFRKCHNFEEKIQNQLLKMKKISEGFASQTPEKKFLA